MRARQLAFDQLFGRTIPCHACGHDFVLDATSYRGVDVRDRVHVEAVRFACPQCATELAVPVERDEAD
jgi:hypothetical protein